MITVSWYINNLRIFSLKQLFLLVIFLFLAYIPLKPNTHRRRILYFYVFVLMWIIYKFQAVHFRETQILMGNFALHKRSGYSISKLAFCDDAKEKKLVEILQNSKVAYISQTVIPKISLINNITFFNDNLENVCRINDENGKKLHTDRNNIFEDIQLPDDLKDNLLNIDRKIKDGYESQDFDKHSHFKERKFVSTIDTNVIDTEGKDVGTMFKNANTPIHEYLNEISIPTGDENINLDKQMLIDKNYRSRIKNDKNFAESIYKDSLLLNKNSPIKEREKIAGKKAEEKNKKLMLKKFKDENNNLESLKSTRKVAKFINEQKSSLTLDEELHDVLDFNLKEDIKKTKQIKSVSSEKDTLVAGKKRNIYGPILDYEKSEVYSNKPVKGRPNIAKMGYKSKINKPIGMTKYVRNSVVTAKESKLHENNSAIKARRMVITEKKRKMKSTNQEGPIMFQFETKEDFTRKNNFRSGLNRRENVEFDSFIKQLVNEFLQIKSDMKNRINEEKKKMQDDKSNLLERFKFFENIELTDNSKIDGSGYPDIPNFLKEVKDSKKNSVENVIEPRISENLTKDRGRKTYTLESLLKTVQYPMSYKQGKFKHTKNNKYIK